MTTTQYPNSSPKASYATEGIGIDNIRSSKFNLIAITAVLALHGLVSWSLANMDVVTRPIKPITPKPPIEVEMVILPDVEVPIELKEVEDPPLKPIEKPVVPPKAEIKPKPTPPKPKPDPKPKPVNKPVQKPIDKPKPAPVKKTPPPVSEVPEKPVEKKVIEKVVEAPPKPPTPFPKTLTVNESKTVIQQHEDTERLAREKAEQDRLAREKAEQDRLAREKAEQDRLAREKAEQDRLAREKAAANNAPINISAGQAAASWKRKPNFSSLSRLKLGLKEDTVFKVVINLKVDKQGNIANATIAQSSGNSEVDGAFLRAVKSGKFHPFIVDGVPRVGNATLPLDFKVEAR